MKQNLETITGKPKILVVDDDSVILERVKKMMEKEKYDVLTAKNTRCTLKGMRTGIDVILLDYALGNETAIDVLEKIEKQNYEYTPPIYILTGSINKKEEEKLRIYPVVKGIIKKPVRSKRLTDTIKRELGVDIPYKVEPRSILDGKEKDKMYDLIFRRGMNILKEFKDPSDDEKKELSAFVKEHVELGGEFIEIIANTIMEGIWGHRRIRLTEHIENHSDLFKYYIANCPKSSLLELKELNEEYFKYIKDMKNVLKNISLSEKKGEKHEIKNRLNNLKNLDCDLDMYKITKSADSPLYILQLRKRKDLRRSIKKVANRLAKEGYQKDDQISVYGARKLKLASKSTDYFGIGLIVPTKEKTRELDKKVSRIIQNTLGIKEFKRRDERKDPKKGYIKYRIPLTESLQAELLIGSYPNKIFLVEMCGKYKRDLFEQRRISDSKTAKYLEEKASFLLD